MIRKWHVEERGWSDVGYHWVIEGRGEQVRARPINRIGAHCRGHNVNTIGICVVGDNTKLEESWTALQINSLLELISTLKAIFPWLWVKGHRDLAHTECPGVDISKILGETK